MKGIGKNAFAIGRLPRLVTSLVSDNLRVDSDLTNDCHYLIISQISSKAMTHPIKGTKNNKRIVSLDISSNNIHTTTNSRSFLANTKDSRVIIPCSLRLMDISYNPVFRLRLTNSLIELICSECRILTETKCKECILCIIRHMTYMKKPRNRQRSIRYHELTLNQAKMPVSYNSELILGNNGTYNDTMIVTKYEIIIQPRTGIF